ncbi:VanZ family protein [Halalkalibacter alkaliphilus]|uniref:VanZ family protein n=1 Tax=Halalkalibacter alkaliphilus TaxID=2917993 RepID=A0A9X2CTH1_9BACI|nr:VanZ family protein [Halalkalibacter alkaliphilus]MCL7747957.1 VanZ family protein [Halalkalibacter alkaliphilus]
MNSKKLWWTVAILWCIGIAIATRMPVFTGDSTEEMLKNPFFDSAIVNYIARKGVHLAAFGLLALFFWLALRGVRYRYVWAWALATLYGAIDEWHQSFIPERSGLVSDVVIDSVGAFLVLLVVYFFSQRKIHMQKNK